MSTADSIGIMDSAYFVSRSELLSWVNSYFKLNYTKVEQAANGALYCQIVDACHPGKVQMSKVNWNAKRDYEYVANYKVLQQAFSKLNIQKHVDVPKLIRGKYQDNLEFLQWMKRFFDMCNPPSDYEPQDRRRHSLTEHSAPVSKENSQILKTPQTPKPVSKSVSKPISKPVSKPAPLKEKNVPSSFPTSEKPTITQSEINELRITVETLEKERDFYFGKLRDIEVLLDSSSEASGDIIKLVRRILYASEDEVVEVKEGGKIEVSSVNTV